MGSPSCKTFNETLLAGTHWGISGYYRSDVRRGFARAVVLDGRSPTFMCGVCHLFTIAWVRSETSKSLRETLVQNERIFDGDTSPQPLSARREGLLFPFPACGERVRDRGAKLLTRLCRFGFHIRQKVAADGVDARFNRTIMQTL
jgi:hypothetical protein